MALMIGFGAAAPAGAQDTTFAGRFARWIAEHRLVGLAATRRDASGSETATVGVRRAGGSAPVTDST